jgi:integrase/recombinase XerD
MCKTNRSGKATLLTRQQLELFLANLPVKYALLAELMYFTAGRVNEITTLRVRNINIKDALLTIEKSSTKTKETRQVPLPKHLLGNLESWIKDNMLNSDDFIFFTDSRNTKVKKGEKSVSTQSVDKYFRKTFDWVGINGASTHSFRRTRLTQLHIDEGWSLREIMDISGHSSIVSLQQYLDTDKKQTFNKYRELLQKEDA